MECGKKEDFAFEDVTFVPGLETDSAVGKVAAQLQDKTVRMIQRRR